MAEVATETETAKASSSYSSYSPFSGMGEEKKESRRKRKARNKQGGEPKQEQGQQRNGKAKKKNEEALSVSKATRVRIIQALEKFRKSQDEVYTFEENLAKGERAAVHILSRKRGLRSRSYGRGNNRRVSVYKYKKKSTGVMKVKETPTLFTFSQEAKYVLHDLFARYPPDDKEIGEHTLARASGRDKAQRKKDDIFSKPSMDKSEITKKAELFAASVETIPKLKQITEGRSKLPIASFKDFITTTIESHQVVLISGETGCGKTTQVPQFLLDYMWAKGETCKIVCTQPRRISAISVAERISKERGEHIGDTVGYKIRLESKGGRKSSIIFCTNGILLRVLVARGKSKPKQGTSRNEVKDELSGISHIIVDEIHERDQYSDFMLTIMRDILPSYPHLRLILMSATIEAERFSNYFGGCPIIRVPGFTYPVKTFYLEDVLAIVNSANNNKCNGNRSFTNEGTILREELRAAIDEAISLALSNEEFDPLLDLITSEGGSEVFNYQHSSTGVTSLMVFAGKGRLGDVCMLLSLGADCNIQANDGSTALDWAKRENQEEAAEIIRKHMEKASSDEKQQLLEKYLSNVNPERIDEVLIEQLLRRICTEPKDGAILVFLPGWEDINRTRERLQNSGFFRDHTKFLVIPLHSMVPAKEQQKVFERPPPGCRKIILSTNIAETAVTIDDVVYVIDSGRMKEKSYDPYNNVSTLQSSWISKASAKQREGRAGRCQPGICYHLYSVLRAASFPDFQVPEIMRIPIEELCLQVKILDPDCKIEDFLVKTLDPPVNESIHNAIMVLQDVGALSLDEELTELGEKLGSLPVHPLTSKMLLVAILLNCLDPALTVACASDYKDPFTIPLKPEDKKRAADARSELASLYGGCGDQLAVIAAFDCWRSATERGQQARFCSQYFISSSTMTMISRMRTQLQSELVRSGFIQEDASQCSVNARNTGILHAVLVAGLYPNIGILLRPLKGRSNMIETSGGDKVRSHTHSIVRPSSLTKSDQDMHLVIYDGITRGDGGLHIRNCCLVGPLLLLLLATEIVVAPASENDVDDDNDGSDYDDTDDGDFDEDEMETNKRSDARRGERIMSSPHNLVKVFVDRWLSYASTALDVAQLYCLRERLSAAIVFKVQNPGKVLPRVLGASMHAMASILSYDGMQGVSLPSEPVDSLTKTVGATEIGQSDPSSRGKNKRHESFLEWLISRKYQNSTLHYQKDISRAGLNTKKNWNKSRNNRFQVPSASAGMNSYQRPPLCSPTPSGHGAAMHIDTISSV